MSDTPWTTLNKMLRDYERTQSISMTELVRVALTAATPEQIAAHLRSRLDVAAAVKALTEGQE